MAIDYSVCCEEKSVFLLERHNGLVPGELLLSLFAVGLIPCEAIAQIQPDATLGAENSQVTAAIQNGISTYDITGGAVRGSNLFHSFEQFSIATGEVARFRSGGAIANILSRVTGGGRSSLDGTLAVEGSTNLFFLNPAGIMIGPNAQLDLKGSFTASTAEGLAFLDGFVYNSELPGTLPLLTVSTPVGIVWGDRPGSIQVFSQSPDPATGLGSGLKVNPGQTLSLIGGGIALDGATLQAPSGKISLLSAGDIRLANQSLVDVSGVGGGEIEVEGQEIVLTGRSALISDTFGEVDGKGIWIEGDRIQLLESSYLGAATSGAGNSGSIQVNAAQDIEITGTAIANYKQIELNSFLGTRQIEERAIGGIVTTTTASGRTGDISLNAQRLSLNQGVLVSTETFGTGDSGDISVVATDSVRLGGSGILAGSRSTGIAILTPNGIPTGRSTVGIPAGSGGNISIRTTRLAIEDGSGIVAGTTTDSASGDLFVRATESVLLRGDFAPFFFPTSITTVSIGGSGPAGDLTIETGRLSAQDGAPIFADSGARAIAGRVDVGGPAGNVTITATESVELIGGQPLFGVFISSGIRSRTFTAASAGTVQITTPMLILQDGGQITSAARNSGDGGAININAQTVLVSGAGSADADARSGIVASAGVAAQTSFVTGEIISVPASGAGGTITLNADNVTVQDTAEISVGSFGSGGAGNLNLTAGTVRLARGGSLSAATTSGEEGNITVTAGQLTIDDSSITATSGRSNGGNLSFELQNFLLLRNGSLISTDARTATGAGDGGNIVFEGGFILAVSGENSDMIANAFQGQDGRINLSAQAILGLMTSSGLSTTELRRNKTNDISASSELGPPGEVRLQNLAANPEQGLAELPEEPLSGEQLISQNLCSASSQRSEFVVTGRGGVPAAPTDTLSALPVWEDGGQADAARKTSSPLVEAQRWRTTTDGKVVLYAAVPALVRSRSPSCQTIQNAINPALDERGSSLR